MRRRLFGLTTIAAFMALGIGSVARANVATQHFLKMYKVEKQVDLEGEFPGNTFHDHLFCDAGDYAVDGMWQVAHVDQANPQLGQFGDERNVEITRSYRDSGDRTKWHFEGINNADGRAQVKLFITCLGGQTNQVAGHSHTITVSGQFHFGHPALAAGPNEFDHTATCPSGQVPVAPGFRFETGSGYIYRSWPTADLRGWHWAFIVDPGPASITVYLHCLTLKTGPGGAGPHAHMIIQSFLPGPGNTGDPRSLGGGITEQKLSCGAFGNGAYDHYKGLVGAFWINDPFHVWFLGMDPRIKARAFRFWNDGGGDNRVVLGLWCYNDRVGKQIAP